MNFSILLICKKIMVAFLLVFIFVACSSQRHRPKPPKNKQKKCNCPHFMYGYQTQHPDNKTIAMYDNANR